METRQIFSRHHEVIGRQYFWLALFAALAAVALSIVMRFHLAGSGAEPGADSFAPENYLAIMTLHGTLMVFFVLSVAPQSAFGNLMLPAQLGADGMAFPLLNMLSFWLTALSLVIVIASFLAPGGGPISGWTAYPPLSAVGAAAGPGQGIGQTLWLAGIGLFSLAALMGSVNFITTTLEHFRMPIRLTCWNWFIAAILSLLAFSVLLPAVTLLLFDRLAGTSFFIPGGLVFGDQILKREGGSPLLWQHLFWFFGHPEVYIAILPGMGVISEILSIFSRRPLFGYPAMLLSTLAIGFMGLLIWGHHMFISGLNPYSAIAFSVLTMAIAVPSAVKTFNWVATIWGGNLVLASPMLYAMGFLSIFVTGGLSGLFLGQPVLDQYFHDTYFVVAHFHLIMGIGSIFALFAATAYWFPAMFGRMMNETLGKWHFYLTFAGAYAIFLPMHFTGFAGNPRRYADLKNFRFLVELLPVHQWMSIAAYFTAAVQLLFLLNLFWSSRRGRLAPENPWPVSWPITSAELVCDHKFTGSSSSGERS
jgi:cytochrome c oxidase subunit I